MGMGIMVTTELRRYSGVDVTRYSSVTALQLIQHVFHRTRRGQ